MVKVYQIVSLHIDPTDFTIVKLFSFLFSFLLFSILSLTTFVPYQFSLSLSLSLCLSLSLSFVHLTSIFFQFQNCVLCLYSHHCFPTAMQFAKEMDFRVESLSTNGSVQVWKDWRARHCQPDYRKVQVHFNELWIPQFCIVYDVPETTCELLIWNWCMHRMCIQSHNHKIRIVLLYQFMRL